MPGRLQRACPRPGQWGGRLELGLPLWERPEGLTWTRTSLWKDPVLMMVTVASHPAVLLGPGSASDRDAVVALRFRTSGADSLPLGSDFLWAALREPRSSQPALEGALELGVERSPEVSRGSSTVPRHSLALKGSRDQ